MTGIVVGVDGSDGAAQALTSAVRESDVRSRSVTAVLAWDWPEERPDAARDLGGYIEKAVGGTAAQKVGRLTVHQPAPQALLDASHEASLLVVGSRRMGALNRTLFGSVSEM